MTKPPSRQKLKQPPRTIEKAELAEAKGGLVLIQVIAVLIGS